MQLTPRPKNYPDLRGGRARTCCWRRRGSQRTRDRQLEEHRRDLGRAKVLTLQLLPPLVNLLARDVMPPGDVRNRPAVQPDLGKNLQLLFVRPTPPSLSTKNNLISQS